MVSHYIFLYRFVFRVTVKGIDLLRFCWPFHIHAGSLKLIDICGMRFVGLWWEAALSLRKLRFQSSVFSLQSPVQSSGHWPLWGTDDRLQNVPESCRVAIENGVKSGDAIRWLGMQISSRCNKHCNSWPLAHHHISTPPSACASAASSPHRRIIHPSIRRGGPHKVRQREPAPFNTFEQFRHQSGDQPHRIRVRIQLHVRVTHAAWHFNWFWGAQKSCAKILTVTTRPAGTRSTESPRKRRLVAESQGISPTYKQKYKEFESVRIKKAVLKAEKGFHYNRNDNIIDNRFNIFIHINFKK